MRNHDLVVPVVLVLLIAGYGVARHIVVEGRSHACLLVTSDLDAVQELTVSSGNVRLDIEKRRGEYQFIHPYAGVAVYAPSWNDFIGRLKLLTRLRVISGITLSAAAEFGIDERSPSLTLTTHAGTETLLLGALSPVNQQQYIYAQEAGEICLTQAAVQKIAVVTAEDFRDAVLVAPSAGEVRAITIQTQSGKVRFSRQPVDWFMEDAAAHYNYPCAVDKIKQLVEIWRALAIADLTPKDVPDSREYTDTPILSVRIDYDNDQSVSVDVGKRYTGTLRYVAVNGELRGGIPQSAVDSVIISKDAYVRRELIEFPVVFARSFTVKGGQMDYSYEKKRGAWFRTGKKKRRTDNEKVSRFLAMIAALIIEEYLPGEGLGPVDREYVLYDRNHSELTHILIGEKKGEVTKVCFNGSDSVYGVSTGAVEMLEL